MSLLLLFPILCLSDFVVYYTDNIIFVNDSNCANKFEVAYDSSTQSFISNTMKITFNGTIANIFSNNDTYTFIYKQNDHSSDLIFNIFRSVLIYKNDNMIATSAVQGNNIIISSPTEEVLYYINQDSQSLRCPLPNKYSYTGILVSNISIPSDAMAIGVGVLLPFMEIPSPIHSSIGLICLFILAIIFLIIFLCDMCYQFRKVCTKK